MNTISVCMIVKDEAENLPKILTDVGLFADELIVVDTGSHDDTIRVAQQFTTKVYQILWQNDFSNARNESLSYATQDYQMWLDADDRVPEQSVQRLVQFKQSEIDADIVMLPYHTAFDAKGATFSYYRERLFKRSKNFRFVDPVHEVVVPSGSILYLDAPIEHRKTCECHSDRNLKIYQNLLSNGVTLSARQTFYYANELTRNGKTDEAEAAYRIFLKMPDGMAENRTAARLNLARLLCSSSNKKKQTRTDLASHSAITHAKKNQKISELLLQDLAENPPSAEILVELGHLKLREDKISEAIFWYTSAMNAPAPSKIQFRNKDMERYLPALQLGLCYYRLDDKQNALRYNRLALRAKPDGLLAQNNMVYYEKMPNKK